MTRIFPASTRSWTASKDIDEARVSRHTPPLDVASLRIEWNALREEARSLAPGLPSGESIGQLWAQLKNEASAQDPTVFEMPSMLAVSAAGKLPTGMRWLSASSKAAASRTALLSGPLCSSITPGRLLTSARSGFITCHRPATLTLRAGTCASRSSHQSVRP